MKELESQECFHDWVVRDELPRWTSEALEQFGADLYGVYHPILESENTGYAITIFGLSDYILSRRGHLLSDRVMGCIKVADQYFPDIELGRCTDSVTMFRHLPHEVKVNTCWQYQWVANAEDENRARRYLENDRFIFLMDQTSLLNIAMKDRYLFFAGGKRMQCESYTSLYNEVIRIVGALNELPVE